MLFLCPEWFMYANFAAMFAGSTLCVFCLFFSPLASISTDSPTFARSLQQECNNLFVYYDHVNSSSANHDLADVSRERASGCHSKTEVKQRLEWPNRLLMHCVSLSCRTGPKTEHWTGFLPVVGIQEHHRTVCCPHDIEVTHLIEVMLWGSFFCTLPVELH